MCSFPWLHSWLPGHGRAGLCLPQRLPWLLSDIYLVWAASACLSHKETDQTLINFSPQRRCRLCVRFSCSLQLSSPSVPFQTAGLGHLEAFALARLCLLKREGVCAAVRLVGGVAPGVQLCCGPRADMQCGVAIFPFGTPCLVIKSQKGLAWKGLKDHPVSHGQGHLS